MASRNRPYFFLGIHQKGHALRIGNYIHYRNKFTFGDQIYLQIEISQKNLLYLQIKSISFSLRDWLFGEERYTLKILSDSIITIRTSAGTFQLQEAERWITRARWTKPRLFAKGFHIVSAPSRFDALIPDMVFRGDNPSEAIGNLLHTQQLLDGITDTM